MTLFHRMELIEMFLFQTHLLFCDHIYILCSDLLTQDNADQLKCVISVEYKRESCRLARTSHFGCRRRGLCNSD